MKLTFYGAAGGVTGASCLVESGKSSLMVDCGMFQGGREAEARNKIAPPVDYKQLNAIILTHAHLDHCGRLPLVIRQGYRNPVFATPATVDLVALILRDAYRIYTSDLEKTNRFLERAGKQPVKPHYDETDVEQAINQLTPMAYHEPFKIAPGMIVTISEAGHILGSGTLLLSVKAGNKIKKIVFSGDLGARGMPIVRDPEPFSDADVVVMETTYGDRDHRPLEETLKEATDIIRNAIAARGKILVPSFAIGRSQDLIYYLEKTFRHGGLDRFPVYLDSPMAIEASGIYMDHPELFDEEMTEFVNSGMMDLEHGYVKQVSSPEESRALNMREGPMMIIAGSGMCNAGRIVHHLRHNIWKPTTSVMIVGYQAEGTLGRQLVDGARYVRIFGERVAVRATVHKLGGFSAHAGQTELLKWFNALAQVRPKVILTHGEEKARETMANLLRHRYGITPYLPLYGEVINI